MKFICSLFFLFFALNCSNSQEATPKEYIEEVLEIVENNSIKRDSVDFIKIREAAYRRLEHASSLNDCYSIVQSILLDLKDNHSFLMTKGEVERWESTSQTGEPNALITFKVKLIPNNIGYIHMRGFSSGDSISIQNYADSLQHDIKLIDNDSLKGWILDLRENTGGNCWPMLTGLGPLLGNGTCGFFIDNNGQKSAWFYNNGESGTDKSTIARVSKHPYELSNDSNPIAVLTGERTASSGEVVTTAFRGKQNTRSFGTETAGLSTGNSNFKLSDGSMILLTTSVYADRFGNVFGKKIAPDEKIEFAYNVVGQQNDPVINKAIEWINERQ